MARFDRNDAARPGIPASLDSAAEQLRSEVDRQVRDIVAAAEERAEAIEDAALRREREAELQAQRREREASAAAQERAARLLDSLDSLEGEIGGAIGAMRREVEALARDTASPPAAEGSGPDDPEPADSELLEELLGTSEAPAPDDAVDDASGVSDSRGVSLEAAGTASREGEALSADTAGAATRPISNIDATGIVHDHLVSMRQAGKTRAQAARALLRFNKGSSYLALLDEVYPEHEEVEETPKKRRFRRRQASADKQG